MTNTHVWILEKNLANDLKVESLLKDIFNSFLSDSQMEPLKK